MTDFQMVRSKFTGRIVADNVGSGFQTTVKRFPFRTGHARVRARQGMEIANLEEYPLLGSAASYTSCRQVRT